jgi:hypothetical protein
VHRTTCTILLYGPTRVDTPWLSVGMVG